jgi:phosphomannomutase
LSSPLVESAGALFDRYLEELSRLRFTPAAPVGELVIAYSAMHGVGEKTFRRAMAARGFTEVHSVAEQAEPDGTFPTVEFPNPEEPGALDRVLALASRVSADVVLVNDPDADRLGVAVRSGDRHVVLDGNEIGVLLGHYLITCTSGQDRLAIATVVSSQLLRRVSEKNGVRYAETLTGFKWIANEALRLEASSGARFVFGYEEALGYTVGTVVRDKDGISAALVMAELAASLKADGKTLLDRLESIRREYGFMLSRTKSVTLPGREGAERIARAMDVFRAPVISGLKVASSRMPAKDVVILELADGARIAVRPSGTEPKIKFYFELAEPLASGEAMAVAEARGRARLVELERLTLLAASLGGV